MKFIEALTLVSQGKKVRCQTWPDYEYIYLTSYGIFKNETEHSQNSKIGDYINDNSSNWEEYINLPFIENLKAQHKLWRKELDKLKKHHEYPRFQRVFDYIVEKLKLIETRMAKEGVEK